MGILEDLKREANNSRTERELAWQKRKELEKVYHDGICTSMLKIHDYLRELVEQLGLVEWPVVSAFNFPGIEKVDTLSQTNYRITIDSHNEPKLINLCFECSAHEEHTYNVMPKSAGDEACQFLATQKVVFTDWAIRDIHHNLIGTCIKCKLHVCAGLAFKADIDNEGIRVVSYNFEEPGERSFHSHYYSIDDQWLDKLGRYILRKDGSFAMLDISEEQRKQIRKLVEEERKRNNNLFAVTKPSNEVQEGLLLKLGKLFHKHKV